MVKRLVAISFLFLLIIGSVFADFTFKGGAEVGGIYVHLTDDSPLTEKNLRAYTANPYLGGVYSASNFRSEFRISFSYLDVPNLPSAYKSFIPEPSLSLEKAYVRFRLPSFSDSKMTFVVGKSTVSWGMGNLFRAGDVLFSNPISNEEAGTDVEKNLWVISASQPIGATTITIAFVPVIESQCSQEKAGILLRRDFDSEYLKEIRAAYVYEIDNGNKSKASLLIDANIGFDVNVGLETQFRNEDDLRFVLNAMKMFSIDTAMRSFSITLYLSGQGDVYTDSYDLSEIVSIDLTDRTSLSLMNTNSWKGEDLAYKNGTVMASTSTTLADGVALNIYGLYCYEGTLSYSGMSLLCYDIMAGAGIEYRY